MSDIGGLIAPRDLMIVAGNEDYLADFEGVKVALEHTKQIYDAFDAADSVMLIEGPGGPHFYPAQAWPQINSIRDAW